MITKNSDPSPEVLWAEKKRREMHNQTVRASKDNKPNSANNRNQTFTIEQLRSRMRFYDGYKMEPPPMPGTKLPELNLDYQLKFAKIELEIYEDFKRTLGWCLTACFVFILILVIGIATGLLPQLTIVLPYILFLFLQTRIENKLSNERSWMFSTKLYVRKQLLKKM